MTLVVDSDDPITLIGGGPVDADLLSKIVNYAPLVIAADSAANTAQNLGQRVDHVIGDMDSLDVTTLESSVEVHPILEQMTTDLDKCLYSTNAPYYLGIGFLAGRLDHQLASCHSLLRASDKSVILVGEEDLCFLAPLEFSLDLPVETRFSLFPMGQVSGTSKGLKWPIDAYQFSPASMIGTSNETDAKHVSLAFDCRQMLVILPIELLDDVISQLFAT